MNRGFALRAAVSIVENELRAARASAVHERSPAEVVLLTRPLPAGQEYTAQVDKVYALGKRTVSNWHLEPSQLDGTTLKGALDQTATVTGTATFVQGKVGRCLVLDGSVSLSVSSPYLDEVREGVYVEAYVKPDATGLSKDDLLPIVAKTGGSPAVFVLSLQYEPSNDGQALFWLDGRVRTESSTVGAHTAALLRADEWVHVAMEYNPHRDREVLNSPGVILRVDGREAELYDDAPGSGALAASASPMLIGSDGSRNFRGRLDAVKVAALVAGEVRNLPRNTEVYADPGGSPDGRIHFDDEGKLDRRFHSALVRFRVLSPSDRLQRILQVNWMGGVEIGEQERVDVK